MRFTRGHKQAHKTVVLAAGLMGLLLSGCASTTSTNVLPAPPAKSETPNASAPQTNNNYGANTQGKITHYNPQNPPEPGATVIADIPAQIPTLKPGTKVIALTSEKDTETEREAIHLALSKVPGISLDWRVIPEDADIYNTVTDAFNEPSDLLVDVGPTLIGGFDLVTASFMDKRTITFGTQMAEPTDNVDAVIWPGADARAAVVGEDLQFTNAQKWADKAVAVGIDAYLSNRKCLVYLLGE